MATTAFPVLPGWRRNRRPLLALGAALLAAVLLLASGLLFSANLTVSTTSDVVDGTTTSITNLIANPGADGKISLREAVAAANNSKGTDTITVPAGTYTLTQGEIAITKTVIINGATSATTILSGNGSSRIFNVSATLTLSNMTLKNARISSGNGGAILKKSNNLTLSGVVFDSNAASNGAGGAVAGTGGTYTWTNVVAQNNTASGGNGGVLYTTAGTLKLTGNTFSSNTAGNGAGGAVWFTGTAVTITRGSFTSNSAGGGNGGAVYLVPSGSSTISSTAFTTNNAGNGSGGGAYLSGAGAWAVSDTSFSSNTAPVGGGGALMAGTASVVSTYTRVTFDSNQAANGNGGGLLVAPSSGGATTTLTNLTVYGNSANSGGGVALTQGTLSLVNVTVANNAGPNGSGGLLQTGGTFKTLNTLVASNGNTNCAGSITTQGNNLDTGNSCSFSAASDKRNAIASLGSLGNNGGNTQTVPLLAASQAINAGTATGAPTSDQRGLTRVGTTDIGAYEFGAGTTGATISGTVFEDPHYGGGAGRDLATAQAASGTGRPAARVELYDSSGALARNTTTASDGSYSFTFLAAGSYVVRVVNATVGSARTGWSLGLVPVQTFRTDAGTGSATAVTDRVGGQTPSKFDADAGSTTLAALATATTAAQSVTSVVLGATNITGVDFGYSFNVVVNANDAGQGSLPQFIDNANALGNTGLAIAGRTAGIDHAVFMLPDGTARAGMNTGYATAFSGGVATFNLSDGLIVTEPVVVDGQTQPGWTANPILELNGAAVGAGSGTPGIDVSGGGTTLRGLIINRFDGGGILLDGGGNTVQGCWIGLAKTGTSASANNDVGLQVNGGNGDTIGGVGTSNGNVISGNAGGGMVVLGSATLIQGNRIGTNVAGTAKVANGNDGIQLNGALGVTIGGTSTAARNLISGNDNVANLADGIWIVGGSSNVVYGNYIGTDVNGTAALANYHGGVTIYGSSNNTIGGTGSGEANLIARNTGVGVLVSVSNGSATGNRISGNSIQNNGGVGIDLGEDGLTANNGSVSAALPNKGQDFPVVTLAALAGTNLTVSGYVGSAAGQSTFAGARVEVFIADTNSAGNGEGQTYLGFVTADASGNFSGTIGGVAGITAGTTRITTTATDASGNTSEFGANVNVTSGVSISGTVFEDVNYGGGAGRSLAGSSGPGIAAARVELYDANGSFLLATSTASGGGYTFSGLAASSLYFVRVVNSSVASSRTSSGAGPVPVMTYRAEAAGGTPADVTDEVGGAHPAGVDAAAGSSGSSLWTSCATEGGTCSFSGTRLVRYGTAGGGTSGWSTLVATGGIDCNNGVFGDPIVGYVKTCYLLTNTVQSLSTVYLGSSNLSGADFGFNFDTVVNTNDSGQGSLRQAMTNANTLGGDAGLAQAGRTAAVENLVFMISNGTTGSGGSLGLSAGGLRAANNYFSSGVATLAPTSALPAVTAALVIDAQAQPGWTATPVVELNGSSAGASVSGLTVTGGGSTLRGLAINRYTGNGIDLTTAGGNTVQGNHIGLNPAGTARLANGGIGLYANAASTVVGGSSATARNVIAGNTFANVQFGSAAASSSLVGNYIGTDASAAAAITNGSDGVYINGASGVQVGGTATGAGNVIAGNNGRGVLVVGSGGGNTVRGNSLFGNANIGIDLANNGVSANDGAKTANQPNLLMDFPVLASATWAGDQLQVVGHVGSAASQATFAGATVDLYLSDSDATGYGEGKVWLGTVTADASGNFNARLTLASASLLAAGDKLTATATDAAGNTSEFSLNLSVTAAAAWQNGSFETGPAAGPFVTLGHGATSITGWTVLASTIDYIGTYWTAAAGSKSLDMQGGGPGGIQQAYATTAGLSYTLTYAVAANPGCTSCTMTVSANGTQLATVTLSGSGRTVSNMGWTYRSATFTATSALSHITFQSTSAGSSGVALDDVRLGNAMISGTVFEDANYGGGAGRTRSASSGTGQAGATVEVYDASGNYLSATLTDSSGNYSHPVLQGATYQVRVVNSSVKSSRSGWTSARLPVQTFRTSAIAGVVSAVADRVGGESPALADAAANGGSATLASLTTASTTAQSLASIGVSSGDVSGIDFGFNFSTVVNTNNSGPGSLRQVLTNAEALGGDGSLAVAGRTAGIEHVIFMISNGTAAAGLRAANTSFSGGIASIALAATLPTLANPIVIDAQQQPGWTATPVVELNGASAGAASNGLTLNGAGSTVRGLVINRFLQNGITTATGTSLVIEGNVIGLNSAGTAASANALNGILIAGGSATIGGLTTTTRNVISGNTQNGVSITGGVVTVRGNFIGSNAGNSGAVANGASGVLIAGSGSSVGGTAAGAGNVIRGNAGKGVAIASGAYTGNAILGNSIYGNSGLGIDLKADGLTAANDGAKTAATSNLSMDSPVFTSASLSGTTLTVAGYVGSGAGQSAFAAARVEIFVADASSSAGQGQTVLGTLTTDASGNFSGTIAGVTGVSNGGTKLTATATDSANNSSEFGTNFTVGMTVSGTVFEDLNYGGGAGRSLAVSGGAGVSGARLEIYDNSGVFVSSTTSGLGGVSGAYSFVGLAPGTYHLRVVSSSVLSQRSGSVPGLLPVLTYRTTASSGTAVAVTDNVGGTNPAFTDPGAASAGASFSTATYTYSNGLSGTAHAVAPVTVSTAAVASVDFGFNFDTVSNTNASGPGSLAQVLSNANALGGDASLAQSGRTAAIENVVFMIPNGTAGAGLRSAFNHFTGGMATISPATGLPAVSSALVIDAQTQPGWAANPVVELNGSSAGNTDGLNLTAAGSVVRGLAINRFTYSGIVLGASATVQGNWLGVGSSGSSGNTASPNLSHGINVTGGTATIGGTGSGQGNVVSGNGGAGIWLAGGSAHVILGNRVGVGADGNTRVGNSGFYGIEVGSGVNGSAIGGTATDAGNVISGQTGSGKGGLWVCGNSTTVQGNFIGTNAAGTAAVPNAANGIVVCSGTTGTVIGGTTSTARNLVSGNGGHGISAAGPATVQGNFIGTTTSGLAAVANTGNGIDISVAAASGSVQVGGTAAGAGNLISGNSGRGVAVQSGSAGNAIQGNRLFGNGNIAIDLNANGVSANDGNKTAGAGNLLIDSPVFSSARATGSQLVVAGYVGSAAGQSAFAGSRVEIYASDNDASGFGGGKTVLGALTADGSGNFSGTLSMPVAALAIGSQLTATATDSAGNTSEFGVNFSGLIVDLVVNDNGDAADASAGDGLCATAGGVCTLRAAIAELNAWASLATPPTIVFALPGCSTVGAAACTITPATALPSVTRQVLIDGSTQPGFSTVTYSPLVEISGAAAPGGTTGLVVSASNSTVRSLAINRFPANGITLSGGGNTLVGMRIGLASSTTTAAANGGAGAYISGTGSLIGGATAADRNVFAGNSGPGITVAASGTAITGNRIGTDASGTGGLGNGAPGGGSGIAVLSASLTGVAISGNTIANNAGSGVGVAGGGTAQVQIAANAMSGNGGLGIDLGNDGVTANTGVSNASLPNQGINMPVITGAGVGGNAVTVYGAIGTGTGQAAFAGARVEFFKAAADATGYGEGLAYLGFLTADAAGRFSGTVAFTAGALNVGDAITATATDTAGNTSEFGPNWTTTSVAALTPGSFNAFDAATPATALTGPITSKVAGSAASFAVIALDNSGTALHPGFTGTVSLNWVDARDDSGALSGSCRASWVDKGSAGTATFSNNSRVTVALTPPPSGTRSMRLKMTYSGGATPVSACSSDAFADLPASFSWTGASDADSSTAGTARALDNTAASGGVVHRAGRPFTVRARALDASGALMTGYDGSPVLAAAGCLLPSGCTAAALTAPGTATSAGTYTNSGVSYAEVGALQVQLTDISYADVDAADTVIGVRTLTSTLLAVGRFIPDSLSVAVSTSGQLGTANAACLASGAGATFIGQGFGWATAPQVTVTALNAAGTTTARWTGSLMKLAAGAGLSEALAAINTGFASFSASYGTVTVTDLGAGQARLTASTTDRFLLDLASGSVQDSVTPTFAWSLGVTDASEAAIAGNPTLTATASQGSVSFNSGGIFHSGRLSLSPGYGDVRSGVRLLAQLQRYTAAGWVTMTEDQGCVTIQNQNVAVETPTGVFATLGACAAPMSGNVTTRGGRAWLAFPGTPAGAPGRLTLRLAGPAATGASCTVAGASAALVPLAPNWLLGGASAVGPQALATWGKPQRDALLRRETW